MPCIANLVYNSYGWIKPSGIDCKSLIPPPNPLFESQYGFGFEEWLFNGTEVNIEGEKYYIGFVEAIRQAEINNQLEEISNCKKEPLYLSTKSYNNGVGNCINTKRLIGKLENWSRLTYDENRNIQHQIQDKIGQRRQELFDALHGDPRQQSALNIFDEYIQMNGSNRLFNVKFKKGYRYNAGNYVQNINAPHGTIQFLPDNFSFNQIPNEIVQLILGANAPMPLILN